MGQDRQGNRIKTSNKTKLSFSFQHANKDILIRLQWGSHSHRGHGGYKFREPLRLRELDRCISFSENTKNQQVIQSIVLITKIAVTNRYMQNQQYREVQVYLHHSQVSTCKTIKRKGIIYWCETYLIDPISHKISHQMHWPIILLQRMILKTEVEIKKYKLQMHALQGNSLYGNS